MKRSRVRLSVVAALFGSLIGGTTAHGQPAAPASSSPDPESDARSRADALIREGVELRREGREAAALDRFRQAHEIDPSARALGQMGLAAKSLRLYVDAERFLDEALAQSEDPWVRNNRESLELARQIVGRQLASLVVHSNVAGAQVWVNGVSVATLPSDRPIRVPAGSALVELRAPGYVSAESSAKLPAEATTTLTLDLAPAPLPLAASTSGPSSPALDVESLPETSQPLRPWIYSTLVVGAVGIGVGTYLGVVAASKKEDRDEICPNEACPTEEGVELDEDARTHATWSTISLSVGGSALAASLVLWIVEMSTSQTPPVHAAWGKGGLGPSWTF